MALVTSPSAARRRIHTETLQDAVTNFKSALTEDQRRDLENIKTVPGTDAVLAFTAQLDLKNRQKKGRSIASRLYTLLESVRNFTTVVDTLVSSNPDIAALVWGSVKLTMIVRPADRYVASSV